MCIFQTYCTFKKGGIQHSRAILCIHLTRLDSIFAVSFFWSPPLVVTLCVKPACVILCLGWSCAPTKTFHSSWHCKEHLMYTKLRTIRAQPTESYVPFRGIGSARVPYWQCIQSIAPLWLPCSVCETCETRGTRYFLLLWLMTTSW